MKKIKNLKCDSCDKEFTRESTLENHRKVIHEQIKPFNCDSCDKSYGTKTHLKRHVENIHSI